MKKSKIKTNNAIMVLLVIAGLTCLVFFMGCEPAISPKPSPTPNPTSGSVNPTPWPTETPGEAGNFYQELSFDYDKVISTKSFGSELELMSFIKENSGGSSYNYQWGMDDIARGAVLVEESVAMDTAVAGKAAGAEMLPPQSGTDYSETNVQVEGIDEADLIKTDGEYIYTVSNRVLFIIKAYPGEDAEVVAKIKFEDKMTPTDLFINGNQLAVFGNFNDRSYFKKFTVRPRGGVSFFNIYDISEKDDPELIKEYKFEGNYFRGRMKGDYVYYVTTSRPNPSVFPPMPIIVEDNVQRHVPIENIHYYDIYYRDPLYITVHAINLADLSDDVNSEAVIVEGSQNLYMSHENIYVTYTQYINEWDIRKDIVMDLLDNELDSYEKELIKNIKSTDPEILSKYEKDNKIYQVYQMHIDYMDSDDREDFEDKVEDELKEEMEEYEYFEFTVINKISVDGKDVEPEANGKVPGHIINQFSMDEYEDVLRIATTVNARWSRWNKERTESINNIYTLDADLEVMDELEGLAEGERIFSTRFMGDRLYMVTFRQVDPFFVIDMSDPNDIEELGELKIPGFSRYLHPYDDDTIIGVGQDATESGRTKGLKISLFDVSDVRNPKEVAKYVTEERWARSTALTEHRAFLFSKEKELLVIPVYSYDYQDQDESYNGAFVFRINKDDIELRGLIDHSSGVDGRYYQPAVQRSLYIEELLYTKSLNLLRINALDDLEGVKNIELKSTGIGGIPIY